MNIAMMSEHVMREAVVLSWISEYLGTREWFGRFINESTPPDEAEFLVEELMFMLVAWASFLGTSLDRNTLVNAMLMEWGINATPEQSGEPKAAGCIDEPVHHDGVNKGMEVEVSGMYILIDPVPSESIPYYEIDRWLGLTSES